VSIPCFAPLAGPFRTDVSAGKAADIGQDLPCAFVACNT
jgi:hypothetical protein